jgi:hypothetical protein
LETIVELANNENNFKSSAVGEVEEESGEQSFEQAVERLKNLILEKENIKIYLESVR